MAETFREYVRERGLPENVPPAEYMRRLADLFIDWVDSARLNEEFTSDLESRTLAYRRYHRLGLPAEEWEKTYVKERNG